MKLQTLPKLAALALCAVAPFACTEGLDEAEDTPRAALLYDLTDAELEQIHAAYLQDEDIELTRARLTAPFDCSLYDQFCDQVGPDAAYAITGEIVDMALDGASIEDIDAHLDIRITEAVTAADKAEAAGEETFRASGSWYYDTDDNLRLKVRNGITTPVIGTRKAWTEAQFEKNTWTGWNNFQADQLCVNAGTNTQYMYTYTSSSGTIETLWESSNPGNDCDYAKATKTVQTDHERNNGGEGNGIQWWYTIRANGCATAEFDDVQFSRCAAQFAQTF